MSARLLVLPGIGDIYWVAVQLRSFCEREGLGTPEVHVWDFDGRRRSLGYVERIPFVTAGGYFSHSFEVQGFHESYITGEQSVFPGFLGFDYYLAVNGVLRQGGTVADAMPGLEADWLFELRRTEEEEQARSRFAQLWPSGYVACHLSNFGMCARWARVWDVERCSVFLHEIEYLTGLPVVLTGGPWDRPFAERVAKRAGCATLVGQTTLDEFLGLFRGAAGATGWPGGNTILATAFEVPTLIVWSRVQFPAAGFYRSACAPQAFGHWYDIAVVERDAPERAAAQLARLMERRHG